MLSSGEKFLKKKIGLINKFLIDKQSGTFKETQLIRNTKTKLKNSKPKSQREKQKLMNTKHS